MKTMCLYLTEEFKKEIDELAKKKNVSTNSLIRLAISEYLEKQK